LKNDIAEARSTERLYSGYESWKRWDKPFVFSPDEDRYFSGEMRGIAVAGADVLEIGYGSGSFLAWARDRKARVAGIEIIPPLIEAGRNAGIEVLDSDLEALAAKSPGRFDTIAALDVFEHFSIEEIVRNLAAVEVLLRPGGHLVLRFPNAQSPFGLAPQNGDPTHKSALSRSVFEQLMQTRRLDIVRYGPSFRIGGGSLGQRVVRAFRALLRNLVAATLNFIYTQNIPWDPVVVLVLRKRP
jgi:2-polyprenyl-3-methyl-5-hydroxy-6-metoxy-1,4-benzoquinol methylase